MNVGHIFLDRASNGAASQFASIVESLDRLTIDQHVLVADASLARSLRALPYVTVGPSVRTPVMAYCLMPAVDVVHIHDDRGGQAGLLLTLTRSVPFVMNSGVTPPGTRNPLKQSVLQRAQTMIEASQTDPESLIEIYRRAADALSKLPQDANCR